MMFARLSAVLPLVLAATLVGASIVPRCDSPDPGQGSGNSGSGSGSSGSGSGSSGSSSAGSCSTGPVQCCNKTFDTKDHSPDLLTGLLGISLGSITDLLGLDCSPINLLGLGGVQCNANAVCCENTVQGHSGSLINIGCVPIIL